MSSTSKTSWGQTKTGTTTTWSGTRYGQANSANPEDNPFSTLSIDGKPQGSGNGAWGKKAVAKEEEKSKYGMSKPKYESTLWGAIKREKVKQEESRNVAGFGKSTVSGFGAKTGFGSFGAKTGFGSFGAKTGTSYSTKTWSSYGSGATKTSGYSYGKSSFGAKSAFPKAEDGYEYITSRGQPFNFFIINMPQSNSNEIQEFNAKHICATPRYDKYPIEMLRWFDYVFGGGINYIDPSMPKVADKSKTGYDKSKTTGFGATAAEIIDVSPWEVDPAKIPKYVIKNPLDTSSTKTPYGVLPPTQIPSEQKREEDESEDEEVIDIKPRGFLTARTLFDDMHLYDGKSHTPGLVNLVPKQK